MGSLESLALSAYVYRRSGARKHHRHSLFGMFAVGTAKCRRNSQPRIVELSVPAGRLSYPCRKGARPPLYRTLGGMSEGSARVPIDIPPGQTEVISVSEILSGIVSDDPVHNHGVPDPRGASSRLDPVMLPPEDGLYEAPLYPAAAA